MTACSLTPGCGFPPHPADAHPCGRPIKPGDLCSICGGLQEVLDGEVMPCPKCWRPATIADLKGLAAEAGLDAVVTTPMPWTLSRSRRGEYAALA